MTKSLTFRAAMVAAVVTVFGALVPTMASAREGAQSVGQGFKCYTGLVLQADGTYAVGRVCYKGV